jgi:DUF4097 and DUF4098 domain-containing protein YvlB
MDPSRSEGSFDRTLSVDGRVRLDISINSGVIRVLPGEPGLVRVRGVIRGRSTVFPWGDAASRIRRIEADPPIARDGNTIAVGDVLDRWLLRGINLLIEVTVPQATEVRALADSGDIRIEGVDGPVECEADSGEITVAKVGSEVRAKADSGSIHIRGVNGPIDARTDSGFIEALEIAGTIDAVTDNGEVSVLQTKPATICVHTDNGRVRVQLAPEGGYSLRVRTDNGRIETPALTRQRSSRHEMEGDIRGGGSVVDIETDNGDIEVIG